MVEQLQMKKAEDEVRCDSCFFYKLYGCLHVCRLLQKSSSWWTRLMFELASHVRRSVHFFASYVSQTNIPVLLEAASLQDDMLQKDSDLHELRDINASLERKVSWFSLTTLWQFIASIPFDQQLRSRKWSDNLMMYLGCHMFARVSCECLFLFCLHVSILFACLHVCMFILCWHVFMFAC